jgi:hypothetical protein
LAVCALFVAISLFSEIYVITHAAHQHDHDGENGACAVCAQLAAVGMSRQLTALAAKAPAAAPVPSLSAPAPQSAQSRVCASSPVTLKVKLNN